MGIRKDYKLRYKTNPKILKALKRGWAISSEEPRRFQDESTVIPGQELRLCGGDAPVEDSSGGNRKFSRLSRQLYSFGLHSPDETMPSILRPAGNQKEESYHDQIPRYVEGNRVVHMPTLMDNFGNVYSEHLHASPKCRQPKFALPSEEEVVQGLGCYFVIECSVCAFRSVQYRFFNVLSDPEGTRGRPRAEINVLSGAFLVNSDISSNSFIKLFASLNIPPPSERSLITNSNYACHPIATAGQNQLHCNRVALQKILAHQENSGATLAMDVAYNNPPKGRCMSQPATQATAPVIEYNTERQMVVDMQTFTQVCATGNVVCNHNCGYVNYPQGQSMSDVERRATEAIPAVMGKDNIAIAHVLSDGSTQIKSALVEHHIEKLECNLHVSRGQERLFFKKAWSPEFLYDAPKNQHSDFKKKISTAIRRRCTLELHRYRQRYPVNDRKFFHRVEKARKTIVPCLTGDHSNCGKNSIVCKAKRRFRIPGLPPLVVNDTDRNNLQEVVDYKLHPHMVIKQRKLYTTNRVEAFHHRTFKTCPKNKLMKRSFQARCMAAVLADSLGVDKSIARVAGVLGCRLSRTIIRSLQ